MTSTIFDCAECHFVFLYQDTLFQCTWMHSDNFNMSGLSIPICFEMYGHVHINCIASHWCGLLPLPLPSFSLPFVLFFKCLVLVIVYIISFIIIFFVSYVCCLCKHAGCSPLHPPGGTWPISMLLGLHADTRWVGSTIGIWGRITALL